MKLKYLLLAMLSFLSLGLCSCGNGGAGLNGSLSLSALTLVGSTLTTTATYVNPTHTDLTGTPITFSIQVGGGAVQSLGTLNTNNSGSVTIQIQLGALTGVQTVTVVAQTGNLQAFSNLDVTGRAIALTPPPAPAAIPTQVASNTPVSITLPSFADFVTVTDPLTSNVGGHIIVITGKSSGPSSDSVNTPDTLTAANGTAPFPGSTITLNGPFTLGINSRVITWTVTDTATNLSKTGITVITVNGG
jgi:hypothetical protein